MSSLNSVAVSMSLRKQFTHVSSHFLSVNTSNQTKNVYVLIPNVSDFMKGCKNISFIQNDDN